MLSNLPGSDLIDILSFAEPITLHLRNLKQLSRWGAAQASKRELSRLLEHISGLSLDTMPCDTYSNLFLLAQAVDTANQQQGYTFCSTRS